MCRCANVQICRLVFNTFIDHLLVHLHICISAHLHIVSTSIKKALSYTQDGFYAFISANYWPFAALIASLM